MVFNFQIVPNNHYGVFLLYSLTFTFSGRSSRGSGVSDESPFESKLFHFHEDFQEKLDDYQIEPALLKSKLHSKNSLTSFRF